ncbi:MAG: carbon-nitrogen hydrolase family protein [Byssovorax sp.]
MEAERTVFAAVQMSSQADVGENLDLAAELIREGARRGAKLALLPENFAYFGDDAGKRALAEDLSPDAPLGPIGSRLAHLSRELGIHVLAGGMPERSGDAARPFNTCAVFGPDGQIAAKYRKCHLFDVDLVERPYQESASTTPGDEAVAVKLGSLQVGLSICYDLRFPELYRALSTLGAEVLVVPSAFTVTTGKDHWHVLLRARAIEAQAYVVAAAQWGKHPHGRQTFGKSCIIDPWGEVVAQASEGEGVITATIDRAYLEQVRASVPSLQHRRIGLTPSPR